MKLLERIDHPAFVHFIIEDGNRITYDKENKIAVINGDMLLEWEGTSFTLEEYILSVDSSELLQVKQ